MISAQDQIEEINKVNNKNIICFSVLLKLIYGHLDTLRLFRRGRQIVSTIENCVTGTVIRHFDVFIIIITFYVICIYSFFVWGEGYCTVSFSILAY